MVRRNACATCIVAGLGALALSGCGIDITAPEDGAVFQQGQTVRFRASRRLGASSVHDFEWRSSVDGDLGPGDEIFAPDAAVGRPPLSVGQHTITARHQGFLLFQSYSDSIGLTIVASTPPQPTCVQTTLGLELISRQGAADGGALGNAGGYFGSISADGRFVAFGSDSTNLIPGGGVDRNTGIGGRDVFVYDRQTCSIELISRQSDTDGGAQANGLSQNPVISADGRFVAFESAATNLVPGAGAVSGIGPGRDVFVFDRQTGTIELASRQNAGDGGAPANGDSFAASISGDGRFVAFHSAATNLIPGGGADIDGTVRDIFVFDRQTGTLELVSRQDVADGGAQANGDSSWPSISADGRFVAFDSNAANLVPGRHVYVFDRQTGALELVSRQHAADGGAPADSISWLARISGNGRFVAFESYARNLIPGGASDANVGSDVFVFDRQSDALELISRQSAADGGAQANSDSHAAVINADGRFVAFYSIATNLIPGGASDNNGTPANETGADVFVFDRQTGTLRLASRQNAADGGAQANGNSSAFSLSADGHLMLFGTHATNLIPGGAADTNNFIDVFVFGW